MGTDIDVKAIAWCREHMPFAEWHVNDELPPTQFESGTFDLVYAISVFTHLDEEFQFRWLAELKRITQAGSVLVLTTHGRHCYSDLPEKEQKIIRESGILFRVGATGAAKLDGLPDFYQNTYHSADYIREEWSRFFTVVLVVERGVNDHQDAVVLLRE